MKKKIKKFIAKSTSPKSLGRPSLPQQLKRDTHLSFRLTEDEAKVLSEYAWRYDLSQGLRCVPP